MQELSKEMQFFIFLLEQYAYAKGMSADAILKQWDESGVTMRIFRMYDLYHCEAVENAFQDIDSMLAEANTASKDGSA